MDRKVLEALRLKNSSLSLLLSLTPSSPIHIQREDFSKYDITNRVRLLFYGFYPTEFETLFYWLEEDPAHEVVFFEDHLPHLKALLFSRQGLKLAEHPRIHFFYFASEGFWEASKAKVEKILSQPFELFEWPHSSLNRELTFIELKKKILDLAIDQNVYCSEYLHASKKVFQNFIKNLKHLSSSKNLHGLKNAFKDKPAIIVGAGPSLYQSAEHLRSLKDKALIFTGGRGLTLLNDLGIEPHFGVGIDQYEEHAGTLRCNNYFELPFIYRSRMHHLATGAIHGTKVYTSGAIGYSWLSWVEEELGLDLPCLQEGLNVVNFSIVLSHYFGCSPIILVGCDLSYTDHSAYGKGIPDEQFLPKENDINETDHTINRGVIGEDHEGRPIFTLWKWTQEALWISEYASLCQINLINATEKGLRIEGVPKRSLKEIEKEYLQRSYDLKALTHAKLEQIPSMECTPPKIEALLEKFKESLDEASSYLDELQRALTKKDENAILLQQVLLESNLAYQHILKRLGNLFDKLSVIQDINLRETKKTEFLKKELDSYALLFSTT